MTVLNCLSFQFSDDIRRTRYFLLGQFFNKKCLKSGTCTTPNRVKILNCISRFDLYCSKFYLTIDSKFEEVVWMTIKFMILAFQFESHRCLFVKCNETWWLSHVVSLLCTVYPKCSSQKSLMIQICAL